LSMPMVQISRQEPTILFPELLGLSRSLGSVSRAEFQENRIRIVLPKIYSPLTHRGAIG
jgi:hypothetical protein